MTVNVSLVWFLSLIITDMMFSLPVIITAVYHSHRINATGARSAAHGVTEHRCSRWNGLSERGRVHISQDGSPSADSVDPHFLCFLQLHNRCLDPYCFRSAFLLHFSSHITNRAVQRHRDTKRQYCKSSTRDRPHGGAISPCFKFISWAVSLTVQFFSPPLILWVLPNKSFKNHWALSTSVMSSFAYYAKHGFANLL